VGLLEGLGLFGHEHTLAGTLVSEVAQIKLFIYSLNSLNKRYSFSHLFGYFYGFVPTIPLKPRKYGTLQILETLAPTGCRVKKRGPHGLDHYAPLFPGVSRALLVDA